MRSPTATRLFPQSILPFVYATACLILFCLLTSQTILAQAEGNQSQAPAAAIPVTINFDNLPTGAVVSNQYPQATFSTNWYNSQVRTWYDYSYGGSSPNGIYAGGADYYGYYNADLNLDFPIPVSNFSFYVLNSVDIYHYHMFYIDVYVNTGYYGTFEYFGTGQPKFSIDNLKSISNITNIRIRNVSNYRTPFEEYLYYDDFTFTPNLNVNITNYRIRNSDQALLILNSTTQNALLAGEVVLETQITPSNFTGGTYSWNVTGTHTVTGGTNQSSIHIRWKETGTYTATVTYTRGGFTATGAISVKVIVPTLNSFTAQADPDQVNRGRGCSSIGELNDRQVSFTLGCWQGSNSVLGGIVFNAQAQLPALTYLTEPGEAGIKMRQYVYDFRKRVNDLDNGNFQCEAHRNAQGEVAVAWQADGGEEMSSVLGFPPHFYQGNTLSHRAFDGPGSKLEDRNTAGNVLYGIDVSYADEYFETYVDYFVGSDFEHPLFTQPLKLATEQNYRYSKIAWKRNAQAIFDPSVANVKYRVQFSNSSLNAVQATGTNNLPPFEGNGNALSNLYGTCPGDPAPSTNKIDGARCFIKQQYYDFFRRTPDEGGWDFWTYQIAKCAFDRNCIFTQRYLVAREFFLSAELIQRDPAMANPPGSPNFNPSVYNPAFVRHCYEGFFDRMPEQSGFDFWVDVLNRTGDYNGVINAFITSAEYRARTLVC